KIATEVVKGPYRMKRSKHRYSITTPIARKICDRGRFLGSAERSFRRVSFCRKVAVTAIEHGNIFNSVASLIRESGPDAVLFRRFGKRTPLPGLPGLDEFMRVYSTLLSAPSKIVPQRPIAAPKTFAALAIRYFSSPQYL